MTSLPQTQCRTIQVETGFLPSPATKLVITQYLEASQEPPGWAWIVVGAFFDRHGRTVWSTEFFVAHLDVELESEEEETQSESDGSHSISDSSSGPLCSQSVCFLKRGRKLRRGGCRTGKPPAGSQEADLGTPAHFSDTEGAEDEVAAFVQDRPQQHFQDDFSLRPTNLFYSHPPFWDTARQGPLPGYWQAYFDYSARRWIHAWQPLG